MTWPRSAEIPGVVLLLALFAGSAAFSLSRESATFDETAHLPAGHTYLDRGDFRLNPEHPPLFKLWAALPIYLGDAPRVDYDSQPWTGRIGADGYRTGADEWRFGHAFLRGPSGPTLLRRARLAMLVPGVLLGLVVFFWARECWGRFGALVALFLFCLSPTMLAHTRLVTTDLPTALAFASTLWCFRRFCSRPVAGRLLVFAVVFGLALLVKFSSLLLIPILASLALVWTLWPELTTEERRRRLRWTALAAAAAVAVGFATLWAGYGFRFAAAVDPLYRLNWEIVGLKSGWTADALRWAVDRRLLPESYLYGLAYFLGGAARRLAFLNGEQSIIGWWYYFPEAFALKTPPALLAALAWLIFISRRAVRTLDTWFIVLPVAIYGGVSIAGNLNIGHRHLAPLYPLLHLACGGLAVWVAGRRRASIALAVLLLSYALSFGFATPGYLSYFNTFAGGADGGRRYLLDSNIDWGQDLPRLKRWMDREGVEQVHLAYFGTADPATYGIRYEKVLLVHDFHPDRPAVRPGPGQFFAVSVNLLEGLYYDHERALAEALVRRGRIGREPVLEWLRLRDRLSAAGSRHPELARWLVDNGHVGADPLATVEETLLSSWLARVKATLEPVARAGDSILIYRIPPEFPAVRQGVVSR